MRKKILRTLLTTCIILSLLCVSLPDVPLHARSRGDAALSVEETTALAPANGSVDTKEEVIYAALHADGSVKGIYSVNVLNVSERGMVTDYGQYDSIKNLTSADAIAYENGAVTVHAEQGRFYYQGNTTAKNLPWSVDISYHLDGSPVPPDQLGGSQGRLEITIETSSDSNVNSSFFDHYMLQISVSLNGDKSTDITAPDGVFADAGSNKLITFTVMPGEDSRLTVSADVSDFSMDPISFQGIPMSFALNMESLDTSFLYDQTREIKDAASQFHAGSSQLKDGSHQLKEGLSSLTEGTGSLHEGIGLYTDGADAIDSGISSLQDGSSSLAQGALSLAEGINASKAGADTLAAGYLGKDGLCSGADKLTDGANGLRDGAKQLSKGVDSLTGMVAGIGNSSALETPAGQLIAGAEAALSITADGDNSKEKLQFLSTALTNTINALLTGLTTPRAGTTEDTITLPPKKKTELIPEEKPQPEAVPETQPETETEPESGTEEPSEEEPSEEDTQNNPPQDSGKSPGENTKQSMEFSTAFKMSYPIPKNTKIKVASVSNPAEQIGKLVELKSQLESMLARYDLLEELGDSTNSPEVKKQLAELKQGASSLSMGVSQLADGAGKVSGGIHQISDGTSQLALGLSKLNTGGSDLAVGVKDLDDGMSQLQEGADTLSASGTPLMDGAKQLTDGADALLSGTQQLDSGLEGLKKGTGEFKEKTQEIDTQIEEQIGTMMEQFSGGSYTPISFLSSKNTNVDLVQFVITAEGIPLPLPKTVPDVPQAEDSFWKRVADLFK